MAAQSIVLLGLFYFYFQSISMLQRDHNLKSSTNNVFLFRIAQFLKIEVRVFAVQVTNTQHRPTTILSIHRILHKLMIILNILHKIMIILNIQLHKHMIIHSTPHKTTITQLHKHMTIHNILQKLPLDHKNLKSLPTEAINNVKLNVPNLYMLLESFELLYKYLLIGGW